MCQVLRTWFNPPPISCPRDIFCSHFGDEPSNPENCCIKHHAVLPDMIPEESRVVTFSTRRSKGQVVRLDRTYQRFTGSFRISIANMVSAWVQRTWDEVRKQNSLLPPTSLLSQELQNHLCERFHVITSIENLSSVLAGWPLLEQYKVQLFQFCQEVLKELDHLRKEIREKKKVEGGKKHEMEGEHLQRIRIPPLATLMQSKSKRDELGEDSLEDEGPPRKKRC